MPVCSRRPMADDVACKVKITRIGRMDELTRLADAIPDLEGVEWSIKADLLSITIRANDVGVVRATGDQVLAALGSVEDEAVK